jgi:Flp pilus assembly protein TadD
VREGFHGLEAWCFADLNRALEIDPKDWQALYLKADLFDKYGKSKEAVEAYQTFLKYAPSQEKERIGRAQERIRALGK